MRPSATSRNPPPTVIPEDRYRESIETSLRALAKQSPLLLSSYFDVLSIDSTVAISPLSLEKLGYLNKKKQMDNKEEVRDEEMSKDSLKNRGGRRTETKITHLFMSDPSDFYGRAGQQELQAHVVQRNLDEMVI